MTDPLDDELSVVAFFLADHATAVDGKVYANGAFWNHLQVSQFPSQHTFAVAAVFEVPWVARNHAHGFAVGFEDADGHPIAPPMEGQLVIGHSPATATGDAALVPVTVIVNGFTIPQEGSYSAILSVNGVERSRYPFRARLTGGR